ncbi:MAG TPA: amidohydrolase family protein [Acidimicrobiales bacterium]|nr:amidohydrolase family protein [Acidimicrobiales bacterium]
MPGHVDSHVHLLPERLGAAIRRFFAEAGMPERTYAYPLDHGVVLDDMAVAGVDEVWTLPYARRPGTAAGLNAATATIAAGWAGHPVTVRPGATVHPGDDDPAGVVRAAVEEGGARVLKLHCSVGDYAPDDRRLDAVWAYVSEVRLPVVVHAGHAPSGHTGADELAPVGEVARRWPDAPVIIAHCGHRAASTALAMLADHPALHADLTPVVTELVALPVAAARAVADRLLFGSDAPNTGFRVAAALAAVTATFPDPSERDAVLGGTARRLQAQLRA